MKQQKLFSFKNSKSHGGKINSAMRKEVRPLNKNRLHHVVMKSQHAKGDFSFKNIKHRQHIEKLIYEKADRYGVHIADFANVGNHLHILIRFQNNYLLGTFFKVTMGLIARIVTKAQKGKKFGRFWDGLVFTRVVSKGRDELQIFDYVMANKIQSELGDICRQEFQEWIRKQRKTKLNKKQTQFDPHHFDQQQLNL